MSLLDLFIQEIHEPPAFPELLMQIEESRPVLPEYDPLKGNTEEWKLVSGMLKGFERCLVQFKIRSEP